MLEEIFQQRLYTLDKETILSLNDNNTIEGLINVVEGFKKHCFGLILNENSLSKLNYSLFYINGEKQLTGDLLELDAYLNDIDVIVFLFSKFLADNYPDIDTVDVFNTFQSKRITMFEKLGHTTYNPLTLPEDTTLLLGRKIMPIMLLDKLKFYQDIFDVPQNETLSDKGSVYLMLNMKNGCVKIGQSKQLVYRERTLQAQEPEVALITSWPAPKTVERLLHKQFAAKRIRGEWFKLTFKDLHEIKDFMTSLQSP